MTIQTAIPKYPRTPHWPTSPSIHNDDRVLSDPSRFVGADIVITEKIDGANTLLHRGQVYGRSTSAPSHAPWAAMVRKHHAWKLAQSDLYLYGEDIYGVHSIEYAPVDENATFRAFALRYANTFASFRDTRLVARVHGIPLVPVLFMGRFYSVSALDTFIHQAMKAPSRLGGEREGVVIRLAQSIQANLFDQSVCKSVRAGHVQTDEHWTRNWRPCALTGNKPKQHRSVPIESQQSVQEFLEATQVADARMGRIPVRYWLEGADGHPHEATQAAFTTAMEDLTKRPPSHLACAEIGELEIRCHIEQF